MHNATILDWLAQWYRGTAALIIQFSAFASFSAKRGEGPARAINKQLVSHLTILLLNGLSLSHTSRNRPDCSTTAHFPFRIPQRGMKLCITLGLWDVLVTFLLLDGIQKKSHISVHLPVVARQGQRDILCRPTKLQKNHQLTSGA